MLDSKRILVIDNDINTIELIKLYLEKEGAKVTSAYDANTAIELFYGINPSLILLDLVLSDISGTDLCIEIRKHSNVPIMIVSSKSDEASILESFKVGVDHYMTKPFSPNQLVARVNALLRRTET